MIAEGPGTRRKFEEKDNHSEDNPSRYVIAVPAIICNACVNTIKSILTEYALDDDPANIIGNAETKRITIVTKADVEVDTLLEVIKEVGYDEPEPPYEIEIDSKKRQKGSERKFGEEANFNPETIVGMHTGAPIVHQLQITTARTNACLDGIVEKFSNIHLQSQHNGGGVVAVSADPSVTDEQLQQAIYSLTGHSAKPVSRSNKI